MILSRYRRAQSGIEYIMITGFALLILIPVIYLLYSSMRGYESETSSSQVSAIARELASTAERVYHYGPPSRLTLEVTMPQGITNLTIRRNGAVGCTKCTELLFTLSSGGTVVTSTAIDLRGTGNWTLDGDVTTYYFNTSTTNPGARRFVLEAFSDHVDLRQN